MKIGFDNDKYIKLQSENILKRVEMFNNKLYLELGGKLFDDYHASRVLPGFKIDAKIEVLKSLKNKLEILLCISAKDIEKNKVNSNVELTYEKDVFRLISELRKLGFTCNNVVVTLYENEPSVADFRTKLEAINIKTYIHTYTKGYPTDIDLIVSEEGYGANEFVETTKPIVVVAAPGPGSGKLATSLSQLYHEYKRNNKAGYAKYETFPIWNIPLKHPVNIAYEAATADLKDVNMIDDFHLDNHGIKAVNYNRDLEVFPILRKILNKICDYDVYQSPTDMGVNMAGFCITDNEVVEHEARKEIIRRYYRAKCDYKLNLASEYVKERIKELMDDSHISLSERKVIDVCLEVAKRENAKVLALELDNGVIVTGKDTLGSTCSVNCIINALKELTNSDSFDNLLINANKKLTLKDILEELKKSDCLKQLERCEAHASHFLLSSDEEIIRKLGIYLTKEDIIV